METHQFFMKRGKIIFIFIGVLLIGLWLGRSSRSMMNWCPWCVSTTTSSSSYSGSDVSGFAYDSSTGYEKAAVSDVTALNLRAADDDTNASSSTDISNRKVVKNGSLSLLAEQAERAAQDIQDIALRFNGYTTDVRVYAVTSDTKGASVTVKVPAENFSESFTAMKKVGVKVQNEQISANDVTEQYIDLEARVKNLQAEETQYLKILEKAQTVDETLNVTKRINETRTKIDTTQKQLEYLQKQVAMSSITVLISSEADVTVFGIRWKPLTEAKLAVRGLLNGLIKYVNTIVAFVIQLPLLLIWLVTVGFGVWVVWKLVQRMRRIVMPHKE